MSQICTLGSRFACIVFHPPILRSVSEHVGGLEMLEQPRHAGGIFKGACGGIHGGSGGAVLWRSGVQVWLCTGRVLGYVSYHRCTGGGSSRGVCEKGVMWGREGNVGRSLLFGTLHTRAHLVPGIHAFPWLKSLSSFYS